MAKEGVPVDQPNGGRRESVHFNWEEEGGLDMRKAMSSNSLPPSL